MATLLFLEWVLSGCAQPLKTQPPAAPACVLELQMLQFSVTSATMHVTLFLSNSTELLKTWDDITETDLSNKRKGRMTHAFSTSVLFLFHLINRLLSSSLKVLYKSYSVQTEQRQAACLDLALFQTLLQNLSSGIKDKNPFAYLLSSQHA